MELGLNGRTVVVTGGSSGIGAEVVSELDSEGARVIVIDRSVPATSTEFIECNIADEVQVRQACMRLPSMIDGLANVAGASGAYGPLAAFTVNYLGLRAITEELLPRLSLGGSVVNVASTAGANWRLRSAELRKVVAMNSWSEAHRWFLEQNFDGATAYDLSKELVVVWSQHAALQRFAADGVRVNVVSPGPVATRLLSEFALTMGEESLSRIREVVGRDGEPKEIASVVTFMLSERSRWINGADIQVDGGAEAAFNAKLLTLSRTEGIRL